MKKSTRQKALESMYKIKEEIHKLRTLDTRELHVETLVYIYEAYLNALKDDCMEELGVHVQEYVLDKSLDRRLKEAFPDFLKN